MTDVAGGASPFAFGSRAEIIFNLGFVYGPVLMVLYFIALAFISRYDISRSGHERHLEILADRQD